VGQRVVIFGDKQLKNPEIFAFGEEWWKWLDLFRQVLWLLQLILKLLGIKPEDPVKKVDPSFHSLSRNEFGVFDMHGAYLSNLQSVEWL